LTLMASNSSAVAAGWSAQAQAFAKPTLVSILDAASERAAELLAPECPVDNCSTVFLDVAAGPGTLAMQVAKRLAAAGAQEARLLVTDFAPGLVDAARARFADAAASGALPAALVASTEFAVLDAHALDGVASGSVTHAGCMFSLNLLDRRAVALRELRRVMAPGGRVVVGTWREAGAAVCAEAFARHVGALAPGAPLPQSVRVALDACRRPEDLVEELAAAGFAGGVTVSACEVTMATQDTASLLGMFRTNPTMAPLLAGAPAGVDYEAAWRAFLAPGGPGHAFMAADGVTVQLPYVANLALARA
jgi:SAM-dependent methyltransferase